MNNIVLCGFMGCGKTTVGKELSKKLEMQFVDMDSIIEQNAGMPVSEIFRTQGESSFRRMETETAAALSGQSGLVISTGGGAVLNSANVKAFKSGGLILLIDVPCEVIANRLTGDTSRPLLNRPDRDTAMRELYEKRMPLYRAIADVVVENAQDLPADVFAENICKVIAAYRT